MKNQKCRPIDEVMASNMAALMSGEAGMVVPLSGATLLRKHRAGKLEAFGHPLTVRVDHLQEQYAKGFPLVKKDAAA